MQFDEPFFSITVEIDCTNAYKLCKENALSFFLFYNFQAILAANSIEAFRYRLQNERVIVFDQIHIATTVGRSDHTFAFSFMPFLPTFSAFRQAAAIEIERIEKSSGLAFNENSGRLDVIHCSTLPWFSFTNMSHAHNLKDKDGVPKMAFGKFYAKNGRLFLPVSISVHHALLDGFHVGQFVQLFQNLMDKTEVN